MRTNSSCLPGAAIFQNGKGGAANAANPTQKKLSAKKPRIREFCGLFIVLLIVAEAAAAHGDSLADTDRSGPPFCASVLFFRDGDGVQTLTKVWVEVPYDSYLLLKTAKGYEARVEVAVIYEDAGGFQLGRNTASDTIRTNNPGAVLSSDRTRLFYFAFRVTPGRYVLRIVINNEYGDNRLSSTVKINVPSFREPQLQISSLQLARYAEMPQQESTLQKNALSIIPNVPHIFSSESPVCFLYFETYDVAPVSSPTDSFQVCCRLSHLGREIRAITSKHPKTGAKGLVDVKLDLANLEPGEYMLTANVLDPSSKREANAVAIFYIIDSSVWP